MGIFSDTTTDNFWAYYDPASSVWTGYILNDTKSALYGNSYPGIELTKDLAASSEVPTGAAEGDGWAIEVEMREDAMWDDGTPVTANDVAFTFATVRDLGLGGNWLSAWPLPDPEAGVQRPARTGDLAPFGRDRSSDAGPHLGTDRRGGQGL
jgi:ABC-type transport system substrate-binding protein